MSARARVVRLIRAALADHVAHPRSALCLVLAATCPLLARAAEPQAQDLTAPQAQDATAPQAQDATAASRVPQAAAVDYVADVKPILASRCYACHGPLKQEQGLRLDTAVLARQGGESGPAVVPHHSGESLLVRAVRGSDGWRMPPEGDPLTAEQIARLEAWIEQGAPGPADEAPAIDPRAHWAFRPPVKAPLPEVSSPQRAAQSVRNPIDAFVAAEREKQGLLPRPEAAGHVLLRRVYLDLIGLPPAREELHAFLCDESPDAYEKVVERLLASPHYGERWGRHWMDIWRYSDWYGYGAEVRNSQPHIWRWRDWIVDALNADKGYDRMLVEMLAGDELAPTDPDTLRATGFLARNWYRFNRNVWLQDTVEHTCKAFLGLTINCARCHDHKYDPIPQEDFYRLRAYFEPHEIRTDVVDGQLDTTKNGIARVYDAHADAVTRLFVRGDEREPDESRAFAPDLPRFLRPEPLAVSPVALPPAAYYPALRGDVSAALIAAEEVERTKAAAVVEQAQAAVARCREQLAAGNDAQRAPSVLADNLAPAEAAASGAPAAPPSGSEGPQALAAAEAASALAEKKLAAAQARLEVVQAQVAANQAGYADPPLADTRELYQLAVRKERRAALADAELGELAATQNLTSVRSAASANDEAAGKTIADAEQKLAAAKQLLDTTRTALDQPAENCATLGTAYPSTSTGRRLALARWIASTENPLAARVAVNHIWLRHFGKPLVSTVFDFGLNGKRPTHPQLLDWLAVEFAERGWSMKALHRLIVTSSTYRADSSTGGAQAPQLAKDPDNRYLWRMNPRRMEAEIVRDGILAVSRGLDRSLGGPEFDQNAAESSPRRSIYFRQANEKRVTFLEIFDQVGVAEGYQRTESIVPQQALAMLNSGLALSRARDLAGQLWQEQLAAPDSQEVEAARANASFVRAAFEQVLTRPPTADEQAACEAFLSQQQAVLAQPDKLVRMAGEPSAAAGNADPAARARASLVHVLLNHNDFVTIR